MTDSRDGKGMQMTINTGDGKGMQIPYTLNFQEKKPTSTFWKNSCFNTFLLQTYPVCFIVFLHFHFPGTEKFGWSEFFLQWDAKFGSKEQGSTVWLNWVSLEEFLEKKNEIQGICKRFK